MAHLRQSVADQYWTEALPELHSFQLLQLVHVANINHLKKLEGMRLIRSDVEVVNIVFDLCVCTQRSLNDQ